MGLRRRQSRRGVHPHGPILPETRLWDGLFLATETGVYRTDGGLHWYRYMDGLPAVVKARGLEIHATTPDDAHLVLATWGHGVWEKDVEFQDYIFYDGFENGSTSDWSTTTGTK